MEIHQLAYFESVSRHLHFTRAAEELHVAQPSVSQQIRKLETELGAPLFHRMKRHVALTEAGLTFLPHARAVLLRLAEARLEVQELSGMRKGTLAVGAPPSVGTHLLPRALAAFSVRHPGITLTFREAGSRTLLKLLEQGELDCAVVIQPIRHPALETLPLLEEELLLAVPRQHPLANGHRRVRLAQLREEPFVMLREGTYDLRDQTLLACRKAGFEPQVALDGGEMDSMLRFVAAGIGLAILPAMVLAEVDAHDGVVAVRRLLPRLSRSLVLARRRDRYFSTAAREFAGCAQLRQQRMTSMQSSPSPAARWAICDRCGARGWLEPGESRACAECGGPYRRMALLEGLVDHWFAPPAQHVSEFLPRHLKLIELMWTAEGRGRATFEAMALEKVSYTQFVTRATQVVVRGLAEGWIEVDIPAAPTTDDALYRVRFKDPDRWADGLTAAFATQLPHTEQVRTDVEGDPDLA